MGSYTGPIEPLYHALDNEVFVTSKAEYIKNGDDAKFTLICEAQTSDLALTISQALNDRFREAVTPLEQWKLNPEDRDDGYECIALHRGKWRHVKWNADNKGWSLGYAQPFMADVDRPFIEIPKGVETDFYGWRE